MKRTPLKRRSAKTSRVYTHRRKLVSAVLAAYPTCEVPWCPHPSTDVHEPLTRARGGSILDPANCKAVCRLHHDLIHLEDPIWYELGFLRHSWEAS
ncbi:MAG: hypothetical protein ACTHON_18980 [Humibacter sp.]